MVPSPEIVARQPARLQTRLRPGEDSWTAQPGAMGSGGDVTTRNGDAVSPLVHGPHSGLLSVGMAKSEEKTRFVVPPFAGFTVPESKRMASGSPGRLFKV